MLGLAAKTDKDILSVSGILEQSKTETQSTVQRSLETILSDTKDLALDRSIDLTVRLWLSLNFREDTFGLQSPQMPALEMG
jgi:hypothetical protein